MSESNPDRLHVGWADDEERRRAIEADAETKQAAISAGVSKVEAEAKWAFKDDSARVEAVKSESGAQADVERARTAAALAKAKASVLKHLIWAVTLAVVLLGAWLGVR